jgi:hypothetical protein
VLTKVKVLLPSAGVVVTLVLLILGSKEAPTVKQDFPPPVAPAIGLCDAINAPATVLLGGLMLLTRSTHYQQMLSRAPIPQIVFLGAVVLLWFVVGIEVELLLTKTVSASYRLLGAGVAIPIVIALVPFGIEAWRQGQAMLSLGCAAWSAVLALFCVIHLMRITALHIKAR